MKIYKKFFNADNFNEEHQINKMIQEYIISESKIFQIVTRYIDSKGQYNVHNQYFIKIYTKEVN